MSTNSGNVYEFRYMSTNSGICLRIPVYVYVTGALYTVYVTGASYTLREHRRRISPKIVRLGVLSGLITDNKLVLLGRLGASAASMSSTMVFHDVKKFLLVLETPSLVHKLFPPVIS